MRGKTKGIFIAVLVIILANLAWQQMLNVNALMRVQTSGLLWVLAATNLVATLSALWLFWRIRSLVRGKG